MRSILFCSHGVATLKDISTPSISSESKQKRERRIEYKKRHLKCLFKNLTAYNSNSTSITEDNNNRGRGITTLSFMPKPTCTNTARKRMQINPKTMKIYRFGPEITHYSANNPRRILLSFKQNQQSIKCSL